MVNKNFVKISATKNTFLFFDLQNIDPAQYVLHFHYSSVEEFVRVHCESDLIGKTDGLVFVQNSKNKVEYDYEWFFYNKDGSSAEMCGNASRAMWAYCKKYLNFSKNKLVFKTLSGLVSGESGENNQINISMPKWQVIESNKELLLKTGYRIALDYFNTGVPHVVISLEKNLNLKDKFNESIRTLFETDKKNNQENLISELRELSREVRINPIWGDKGSNVTFCFKEREKFFSFTYERGVEDFTLSCGTGAVASAISILLEKIKNTKSELDNFEVPLILPGGPLNVQINFKLKSANLIGTASIEREYECLPKF